MHTFSFTGPRWWRSLGIALTVSLLGACSTTGFDVENARSTLSGYRDEPNWRALQQHLPVDMQLSPTRLPAEQYWKWQGHEVHLDRYENPSSPVKLILLHGVGTNGRQMSLITGAPLARRGIETVAPDLPGYGMTRVHAGKTVRYDDWVQLVSDLIDAERQRDARPVVLYGLSAGGMLAYHAAARNRQVAGIIGMTFLDQRVQAVRDGTALNWFMSRVGVPAAELTAATPLAPMKMPMSLASKMHFLTNHPEAQKVMMGDRSSAGNWASMAFLASYMNHVPAIEPEDFDICPILLTQPAADRWTPLALSEPVLSKIRKVPVRTVMLENAGHFPLEQPGLKQMEQAIHEFILSLPAVRAPATQAPTHTKG